MRAVTVMVVAAWVGGFLLVFHQDYASAAGNETVTRTFQPSSADTYNDEKNPGTNYGSSAVMDVGTKTSNRLHSLVQFDISSLPIHTDSTVNSANLSLYLSAAPTTSRTHGAHRVTSTWAEGSVTWTGEPSFDGTATASTITGTAGGVWLIWDVTADVSAYLGGTATNYGWLIKDSAEGISKAYEFSYATKEEVSSSLHPTLSIAFTAPWDSHTDAAREDPAEDTFANADSMVYMKGTGFANGNYDVGYYDGADSRVLLALDENISVTDGTLNSEYLLTTDKSAAPGTWHALVQPASATPFPDPGSPTDYDEAVNNPDTYELLTNDSFLVEASAIPEFPTVMAGITVAGLCFGIYYWMRKRRLAYVKA